MKHIFDVI